MAGREGGQPGPDSRVQWRALTAGLGSGPGVPGLRGRAPRRLRRAAGGEARQPERPGQRKFAVPGSEASCCPRRGRRRLSRTATAAELAGGALGGRSGHGAAGRPSPVPEGAWTAPAGRVAPPIRAPPAKRADERRGPATRPAPSPRCSHHATRRLFKLAAARPRLSPDEIQGIENVDCLTHRPPDAPGAGHSSPRFHSCRHTAARARCWNTAALNEPHYERAGAKARRLPVARWPVARSPMARSASCTGVPTYRSGALAARE